MKLLFAVVVSMAVFSLSDTLSISVNTKDMNKEKSKSISPVNNNNKGLPEANAMESPEENNKSVDKSKHANKLEEAKLKSRDKTGKGSCGIKTLKKIIVCLIESHESVHELLITDDGSEYSYEHSESHEELESEIYYEKYEIERHENNESESSEESESESFEDGRWGDGMDELKGIPADAVCLLRGVVDYVHCIIAEGSAASNIKLNSMDGAFKNDLSWEWLQAEDGHFG